MVVLVLFIQIVGLVFYFKMLDAAGDFAGDVNYTFEKKVWYFIVVLNLFFILRVIYIEINFSYKWYDQIMEFISLGISIFIVIPTTIYYLIKKNRKQKKK